MPQVGWWESEATEVPLSPDKAMYLLLEVSGKVVLHHKAAGLVHMWSMLNACYQATLSSLPGIWKRKRLQWGVAEFVRPFRAAPEDPGANTWNSKTSNLVGEERKISLTIFLWQACWSAFVTAPYLVCFILLAFPLSSTSPKFKM